MHRATEQVVDSVKLHHSYSEPRLEIPMRRAMADFYRQAITQGWQHAEQEKKLMPGRRQLAGITKGKVPRLPSLERIFRSKYAWPAIMRRSDKLADRLRKAYLSKLQKKFKELVPRMLDGSASPAEIKAELMQSWKSSQGRVEGIFRTETTRYFAQTQVAFFEQDDDIIGFLFDSVRDVARTDICRSRHGLVYRPRTEMLKQNTPSLHWNCRSHLIALANTTFNRKLLEDSQRDPSKKSVTPLPRGWNK